MRGSEGSTNRGGSPTGKEGLGRGLAVEAGELYVSDKEGRGSGKGINAPVVKQK